MRIIYYSYLGTYAAYTMAALHTGLYPRDKLPGKGLIAAQYELCRRYGDQTGNLIYAGMDSQFTEIYCLGCRRHGGIVVRAIQNISEILAIYEPVQLICVEKYDGILPMLIQKTDLSNYGLGKRLFDCWFSNSYTKCLQNGLWQYADIEQSKGP